MMRATGYLYIKTDYNLNNRVLFRQNLIKKIDVFLPNTSISYTYLTLQTYLLQKFF